MKKKKIYKELVEIRKELQEIRNLLDPTYGEDPEGDKLIEEFIERVIKEPLYETVAEEHKQAVLRGIPLW